MKFRNNPFFLTTQSGLKNNWLRQRSDSKSAIL
jgi:hypothetical protein